MASRSKSIHFISLTADFGEWVRRTNARRRFRRAAVAAALAVTSSEAVRLRESNSILSPLLLLFLSFSIDASIERYRDAATAVPLRSSTEEAAVDVVIAVIIVNFRWWVCGTLHFARKTCVVLW
jgi:hypothetical protein